MLAYVQANVHHGPCGKPCLATIGRIEPTSILPAADVIVAWEFSFIRWPIVMSLPATI